MLKNKDCNSSEQRALVTDPHTGKQYDLTEFFNFLKTDGTSLERLHYVFDDMINGIIQGVEFDGAFELSTKNMCSTLYDISVALRPEAIRVE